MRLLIPKKSKKFRCGAFVRRAAMRNKFLILNGLTYLLYIASNHTSRPFSLGFSFPPFCPLPPFLLDLFTEPVSIKHDDGYNIARTKFIINTWHLISCELLYHLRIMAQWRIWIFEMLCPFYVRKGQ